MVATTVVATVDTATEASGVKGKIIMNISQATKRFFSNNLVKKDDFGSVQKGRDEAARVDAEVGRIHSDTVDLQGELGDLKESSKLRPPTFADVSNAQVMLGTTSAGAVIGGTMGVLSNLTSGSAEAIITEQTLPIYEPKLNGLGFDTETFTVGGTPQNPQGWDIDIHERPLINEKVGEYTVRDARAGGVTNIAVSGLVGAGIGAGVGALTGGAVIGLRKVMNKEYNGTAPRETQGDTKVLIAGGAAGAVIGAGAGAVSSLAKSNTVSFKTESYSTNSKVIGSVPSGGGFHIPNEGGNTPPANTEQVAKWMNGNLGKLASKQGFRGTENLKPKNIEADVPKRNMMGKVKIDTETKKISVGPSLAGSIIGGAVVGGVTGVAGGVLVNVLRKTL